MSDPSIERFNAIVAQKTESQTDELVRLLDLAGFWTQDWLEQSVTAAKKQWVRKAIRSSRDDDNRPLWANLKVVDEAGDVKQIYKRVLVFEKENAVSLKDYHRKQAEHHMLMANWYTRVQERLTGEQLDLPFPEAG